MMSFGKFLKKLILHYCRSEIHDFHVIDINFAFGASGNIKKIFLYEEGRITQKKRCRSDLFSLVKISTHPCVKVDPC